MRRSPFRLPVFLLTVTALASLACLGKGKDDEEDEDTCAAGFVLGADGNCYAVEGGTTGSGGTTSSDPTGGGGGGGNGAVLIDMLEMPGCPGSGRWIYWAQTQGWTNGENLVNVWETGPGDVPAWNEEHDLPSVAFTEDQDELELQLEDGVDLDDFQPNVNTLFTCGIHDQGGSNTYVFRVYDEGGNFADCAIVADAGDAGVEFVLDDPAGVGFNSVSRPNEISRANCDVF